jgi:uncharacterized OB-fold protein
MTAEVWMGYLLDHEPDYTVIQSPFVLDGARVFGADSDATTLAVAAILHRQQHETVMAVSVPDGIDGETVAVACGLATSGEDGMGVVDWDLLLSDEATLVLARSGAEVAINPMDVEVEVDSEFHAAMEAAWDAELASSHVSQGAYVSMAQYGEAAAPRLNLQGQQTSSGLVWPPRFTDQAMGQASTQHELRRRGSVLSWTTLSAAGAPSEFSLRAPVLGGVSTVLLELEDGPNGVFLLVDDEESDPDFGQAMELVLRRIYAQEGFIRYGLKARAMQL